MCACSSVLNQLTWTLAFLFLPFFLGFLLHVCISWRIWILYVYKWCSFASSPAHLFPHTSHINIPSLCLPSKLYHLSPFLYLLSFEHGETSISPPNPGKEGYVPGKVKCCLSRPPFFFCHETHIGKRNRQDVFLFTFVALITPFRGWEIRNVIEDFCNTRYIWSSDSVLTKPSSSVVIDKTIRTASIFYLLYPNRSLLCI